MGFAKSPTPLTKPPFIALFRNSLSPQSVNLKLWRVSFDTNYKSVKQEIVAAKSRNSIVGFEFPKFSLHLPKIPKNITYLALISSQ